MATYLPNISDYIPQTQPFQPDFNFLANVLQTKQTRYDAARSKISSLYGSLLNSPLSRSDNEEKRQQFFKDIEQDIEKVSGLDLSLRQNQEYAQGIFNGLLDDKGIVKDMVWTKSWTEQLKKADYMKSCVDPEKCGGKYWDGGVTYLMYKRKEFMEMSPDQALNFENPEFIPAQNLFEKTTKYLKEAGLSIKYDKQVGNYIVTTKNGNEMTGPLAQYLTAMYATDPSISKFYEAQNYVARKTYAANNAEQYGSEQQAEVAYIQNYLTAKKEILAKDKRTTQASLDAIDNIINSTHRAADENGKLDNDPVDAWFDDLFGERELAANTAKHADYLNNVASNTELNNRNISLAGKNIDIMMASESLQRDILYAADLYANLTMESTMKADAVDMTLLNIASRERMHKESLAMKKIVAEAKSTVNQMKHIYNQLPHRSPKIIYE